MFFVFIFYQDIQQQKTFFGIMFCSEIFWLLVLIDVNFTPPHTKNKRDFKIEPTDDIMKIPQTWITPQNQTVVFIGYLQDHQSSQQIT